MDDAEKELIRTRTDIVELISSYTSLKQAGSRYKGLCPFHQEKTPSFTVDPETSRWRCFGACQEGGDVFKFLEKAESLTFIEAAERLAERAGITLTGKGDAIEAQRLRSERDRLYNVNAAALQFFRDSYKRFRLPQEYAVARGLTHETLEEFGVGYAPDDWEQLANYLLKRKVNPDDAVKAGLIIPSRRGDGTYMDRFRGRLIFPIIDTQERVVGFGGRLIVEKPDAPKYLNSPETPVYVKSKTLYALNRARKAIGEKGVTVVVEGYMDAIAAHQAGIANVVATCGTSLTGDHARLLRRYAGENKTVVLSFDADKAGLSAALRAAETITSAASDLSLRILSLPPGEDPDSLIRSGNAAGFRKAIDDALTVPEFRLKSLEAQFDLGSDSGSIAYLKEAAEIIASVPSPLERDLLIRRIARFHPSFGTNSIHAEESVRQTVDEEKKKITAATARSSAGSGDTFTDFDAPPPNTEPTHYIPAQRRGGPVNGSYYNPRGSERPIAPFRAIKTESADERAERTLLRALLSTEWSAKAMRRIGGQENAMVFTNALTAQLMEALWPLLSGKIAPREALSQLSDSELIRYAEQVLFEENGPTLSEEAITDATLELQERGLREKNAEIRREITRQKEGYAAMDDEQLREYMRNLKALRGKHVDSDAEDA